MEQLRSRFNKEYFEYYAKYSLIMVFNKKYYHLKKGESPDWQSTKLNIGVEVTRAIDKDICLAYDIINEYFDIGISNKELIEKIQEKKSKCKDPILESDIESSLLNHDNANIDNLKKSYLHKTMKLNRNYIHYDQNQLYMFTFRTMDENEVIKCFDIDLSKYKHNYDLCFVNCFDRLYICDFVKKEILHTLKVSNQLLQKIKDKAYIKTNM